MSKAEMLTAMKEVESQLDKQYKDSGKMIQKLGDKVNQPIPSLSTNLPSVDNHVISCGGIPRGRVVEIFGPESSGKTAFCLHLIGNVQKAGGVAAFVDAEHALDPTFADTLGVNMDDLFVSQPDYGEQALEVIEKIVENQAADLVVVDSVTALVPKAELEGDMGDSHMGLHARLMSQAMRKLIGLCSKKDVTVVFINQIREKVGVTFGNPEVTTGGRALKFFASLRLEVRRLAESKGGSLKDGDTIVGHRMRVKAVKNKVGKPFRETEIDLYYDSGFAVREDALKYAKDIGVVTGSAWLTIATDENGVKYRKEDLLSDANFGKLIKALEESATQEKFDLEG
jgi:recombination protein RecA